MDATPPRPARDVRRVLGVLLGDAPVEERRVAGAALGLVQGLGYRIAAAPLFAVWDAHPNGPEDVVPTRHGPIHAVVLTDPDVAAGADGEIAASPCGIGVATGIDDLHHWFRTALVALRLCEPPGVPNVTADAYGGLVGLLADASDDSPQPGADGSRRWPRTPGARPPSMPW